jgi:Rod binding domain-containing protein
MKINTNSMPALKTAEPKQDDKVRNPRLMEAAKGMESVFLGFVMKSMEKSIGSGFGESGDGNGLAQMMFSSVMGKEIADKGGFGLADIIYKSLEEKDLKQLEELQLDVPVDPLLKQKLLGSKDE